jgi:hypothetical protein
MATENWYGEIEFGRNGLGSKQKITFYVRNLARAHLEEGELEVSPEQSGLKKFKIKLAPIDRLDANCGYPIVIISERGDRLLIKISDQFSDQSPVRVAKSRFSAIYLAQALGVPETKKLSRLI